MLLQQFFFGFDVSDCALVYFLQFIGVDLGTDDCVLFRFDNDTADALHYVIRTVLCRNQGFERRPFSLGGVLQAAVYAVQFFL